MEGLRERIAAIVERHRETEGAALPILHAVQEAYGYVPAESVPMIAEALNRSRAEIHGVVTFYHDFRSRPAGRHVVKLCRAEACQSMGGASVIEAFQAALGLSLGETSADGRVTLEPVYCLGLCATAPSAMIDGTLHGRLDADSAGALAARIAS